MSETKKEQEPTSPKDGVSPGVIAYLETPTRLSGKPLEYKGKTTTTAPGKLGGKEV